MRKGNANMTRTYRSKIINRSTQIGFYGIAQTAVRNRNYPLDPLIDKSVDSEAYGEVQRV